MKKNKNINFTSPYDTICFMKPPGSQIISQDRIDDMMIFDLTVSTIHSAKNVKYVYLKTNGNLEHTKALLEISTSYHCDIKEVIEIYINNGRSLVHTKVGILSMQAIYTLKNKPMKKEIKVQAPEGYRFKNGKTEKTAVRIEPTYEVGGYVEILLDNYGYLKGDIGEIKEFSLTGYRINVPNRISTSALDDMVYFPNDYIAPSTKEAYEKQHKKKLPTTIEELKEGENVDIYWYNSASNVNNGNGYDTEDCTTKEMAEAIAALTILIRYRDAWNEGWKYIPGKNECHGIYLHDEIIKYSIFYTCGSPISLRTKKLADQFLIQFKDLLEKAKPLL